MTFATGLMVVPIVPMAGATLPTGILGWSDAGAFLVWLVLMAFVGSLLGILRERTSSSPPAPVTRRHHMADAHLKHAA